MSTSEDPNRTQEIQLGLSSIVERSDKWLGRLRQREFRVRLASSFLTTILVFCAIGLTFLVFFLSQGQLNNFLQNQGLALPVISFCGLMGLVSGFTRYFLLRRKHNAELRELSTLVSEMKRIEKERNAEGGSEAITENALSLADRVMTLLPELSRKRNQDSLLFGIVAFILVDLFGKNLPLSILVGVIVWLYFRYEIRKNYEQEIEKFEEQRRVFEQRKKDFMETL